MSLSEQKNVSYENEMTQSNMFEIDYVMRWNFFERDQQLFYDLRNKFLTVYNF